MSRVLLRRMQEIRTRGVCEMSLGVGTAMPFTYKQPVTLNYQTRKDAGNSSTSYTFSNIDIGAPAANRYITVCVAGRSTSTAAHTIGSVVINTTTGTINVQAATTAITAGIVTGKVTGSTLVSITVNFSTVTTEKMTACCIDVWRVTGLGSATAAATTSSLTNPATAALAGTVGGFCVGLAAIGNGGSSMTWSGSLAPKGQHGITPPPSILASVAGGQSSSTSYSATVTYSDTATTSPSAVFAAF